MTDQVENEKPKFADLLHDPENLPTDPEALAALIAGTDPADTDDTPKGDEPKGDEPASDPKADEPKGDAPKTDEPKGDAPKGDEPKGDEEKGPIKLPSGKEIPYEVLAATRRREDAERRAREEAEARIKELEAEIAKTAKGGEPDPKSDEKTAALKERIEALKADVPEVAELFDGVLETVNTLTAQVNEFKQRDEEQRRQAEETAAARVQAAIDANATLRYWQNEKPDLFNEAARFDRQLRESPNPKMQGLTMEQRFDKVVELMEELYGPAELPEGYAPKDKPKADPPPQEKSAGKQDAKAGTEVKGKESTITLSDLPGGAPPKSDQKAVEDMTTGDIQQSVDRMLDKGMGIQEILANYR
jgi:hypothetical protein